MRSGSNHVLANWEVVAEVADCIAVGAIVWEMNSFEAFGS
jgi:hypothetical protein